MRLCVSGISSFNLILTTSFRPISEEREREGGGGREKPVRKARDL